MNSEKKIKFNLWAKRAEVLKEDPFSENSLFKNGDIIIFVYDVTKKESYNSIETFWYKLALKYSEDVHFLVVLEKLGELETQQFIHKCGFEFADSIQAVFKR